MRSVSSLNVFPRIARVWDVPDVQLRTLYGGGEIASMSDKLPAKKRNIGISVRAIGRWKGESM